MGSTRGPGPRQVGYAQDEPYRVAAPFGKGRPLQLRAAQLGLKIDEPALDLDHRRLAIRLEDEIRRSSVWWPAHRDLQQNPRAFVGFLPNHVREVHLTGVPKPCA